MSVQAPFQTMPSSSELFYNGPCENGPKDKGKIAVKMKLSESPLNLPLAYFGNTILLQSTNPISKIDHSIREVIERMIHTIKSKNGVGLAGPQIGLSLSLFIASFPEKDEAGTIKRDAENKPVMKPSRVFINPTISDPSEETWVEKEGCLSIPGVFLPIERPVAITISALDEHGKEFSERLQGWDARIFMHEYDHLQGTLISSKVILDKELERALNRIQEDYLPLNDVLPELEL